MNPAIGRAFDTGDEQGRVLYDCEPWAILGGGLCR
jgi:hypothetical protein